MILTFNVIQLWLALCVATNSSAWLSTAVLVTNMRNFPLNRGMVAGILKGYAGLSAAVYTEIYSLVLHNSSPNLLLFLAVGVPILCFLVMYLVRPCTPPPRDSSGESIHFVFIQVASVVLGIYLLTSALLGDIFSLSPIISYIVLGTMVVFLIAPLMIPLKMTLYPTKVRKIGMNRQESYSSNAFLEEDSSQKTAPLLNPSSSEANLRVDEDDKSLDIAVLIAEGEGAVHKTRRPKRGEDFKFKEAIVKADFWLLFLVYFVGVGSGVTVLNNLAQIGIALGFRDATILLSLFSFFNFVGRLGSGSVSEYFVRLPPFLLMYMLMLCFV